MAREPDGELPDVALIAQAGKEPLHEGEAGRQSARGELMAAGRVNPGINIAGRGLRQVRIERGLPRLRREDGEAFKRANAAFLHRLSRHARGERLGPQRRYGRTGHADHLLLHPCRLIARAKSVHARAS
jgi:hypothetical protein